MTKGPTLATRTAPTSPLPWECTTELGLGPRFCPIDECSPSSRTTPSPTPAPPRAPSSPPARPPPSTKLIARKSTKKLTVNQNRKFGAAGDRKIAKKLKYAYRKGYYDKVYTMIATPGIDVDAARARGSGRTALYCASEAGYNQIVDKLLEANADRFKKSRDGLTPLNIAEKKRFTGICEALQTAIDAIRASGTGQAAQNPDATAAMPSSPRLMRPALTKDMLATPVPMDPTRANRSPLGKQPPSPMMGRIIPEEHQRFRRGSIDDGAAGNKTDGDGPATTWTTSTSTPPLSPSAVPRRMPLRTLESRSEGPPHRNQSTANRMSMQEAAIQAVKGAPPAYATAPLYDRINEP